MGPHTLAESELASHTHMYTECVMKSGALGIEGSGNHLEWPASSTGITGNSISHTHTLTVSTSQETIFPSYYTLPYIMRIM